MENLIGGKKLYKIKIKQFKAWPQHGCTVWLKPCFEKLQINFTFPVPP